jgi:ElaB/YqjD/DUF883 family membrane-anchored ribosome-binding protein
MNDVTAIPTDIAAKAKTIGATAQNVRAQTGETVRSFAEEGKAQVAATLEGLVKAAQEFAERIGPAESTPVARFAHEAANALGDWSSTVNEKSVDELLEDGRTLVRKSPAVALGVAVAAGFALSRFLKATTPR